MIWSVYARSVCSVASHLRPWECLGCLLGNSVNTAFYAHARFDLVHSDCGFSISVYKEKHERGGQTKPYLKISGMRRLKHKYYLAIYTVSSLRRRRSLRVKLTCPIPPYVLICVCSVWRWRTETSSWSTPESLTFNNIIIIHTYMEEAVTSMYYEYIPVFWPANVTGQVCSNISTSETIEVVWAVT